MRHGDHDNPVRPRGAGKRTPKIPRAMRQAIASSGGDHNERLLWLQPTDKYRTINSDT